MEFFTMKETAAKLKISVNTVRKLLKNGELKYCRVGRQIRITGKNIYFFAQRGLKATATTTTDTEGAPQC